MARTTASYDEWIVAEYQIACPQTKKPAQGRLFVNFSALHEKLQAFLRKHVGEFDGDAFLEVADDAAAHVAEPDWRPERGSDIDFDGGAGHGKVDDAARIGATIVEIELGPRVARRDALVAAIFGQIELVLVRQPGQLGCELLAFAVGDMQFADEAVIDMADHRALQPADMIDIGDDALSHRRESRALEGDVGRGHVDGLAVIFDLAREQHEPAVQVDCDALRGAIGDRDTGGSRYCA